MVQYKKPICIPTSAFSALPIDLKLIVFDFVQSKVDQGNARLVSRQWNRLMKPRMWRDFTTSLRGSFAKDFDNLVDGKQDCLHHIRELTIGGRDIGHDYDARFSSFTNVLLGQNQLLKFTSDKKTPINSMQLLCLLRRQSNLQSFSARLNLSDVPIQHWVSWVTDQTCLFGKALLALRFLKIYVKDQSNGTDGNGKAIAELELSCSRLLIKSAPRVECVHICGWRRTWNNQLGRIDRVSVTTLLANFASPTHIFPTLRRLILTDIDICGNQLIEAINIATLRSLKIEYCNKIGVFLCALAVSVRQIGTQLTVLTVRTRKDEIAGDDKYIVDGLNDLLCSLAGLEELELDLLWCGLIDWKASLGPHQKTLKRLLVSSPLMGDGSPIWPKKITLILAQCPNVQYFAFLPTVPSLGEVADCQFLFSLPSTLHKSLNAVAAAPRIRTLRLLYAPGLGEERAKRQESVWAEKAAKVARRFAALVLSYLRLKGSNVKLLALSPISRWEQERGDSNQHYYPHYYYRHEEPDLGGESAVEVVSPQDYWAECLDDTIWRSF